MIKSDNILELNDKLNSLRYCLGEDSPDVNSVEISKSSVVSKLSDISEQCISSVSEMNGKLPTLEKSQFDADLIKRLENGLKNKMTTYMSAIYKAEMMKRELNSSVDEFIKVSHHVKKFIQNV